MNAFLDISVLSFYISFLGIIGMIGIKASELRSGNRSYLTKITDKTNNFIRKIFYSFKKFLSYINKDSTIALVQWIAYHILSWAREAYIWAHKKAHAYPHSKRVIDMVRGKGEINRNGGASLYLKRISKEEDK